jgi:hypothetical protein
MRGASRPHRVEGKTTTSLTHISWLGVPLIESEDNTRRLDPDDVLETLKTLKIYKPFIEVNSAPTCQPAKPC